MSRNVNKSKTTDAEGNVTKTKTVHVDRPRKTVDKEVRRNQATGEVSRTKSVRKK